MGQKRCESCKFNQKNPGEKSPGLHKHFQRGNPTPQPPGTPEPIESYEEIHPNFATPGKTGDTFRVYKTNLAMSFQVTWPSF